MGAGTVTALRAALEFVRAEFRLILKSEQSEEQEIVCSVSV